MNCNDVTQLLDERDVAELSAAEVRDLEAHTAECAECARQRLASERMARFRADVPALPPALREQALRIAAACESPVVRKSTRRPLLFGSLFVLGAAAATVTAFTWQDASAANR